MAKKRRLSRRKQRMRQRVDVHVYAAMLKNRMTVAERTLWSKLQTHMLKWGVCFESQGVVGGRFIADFVCYQQRLIVELDGSIHNLNRVKAKDKYRTMILERLGYSIIRFNNREVLTNCRRVLKMIKDCIVE